MKVEVTKMTQNAVYGEHEFSRAIAETLPSEMASPPKKYTVYKVEKNLLNDLCIHFEELAPEMMDEDFDEDGELKQYHEDEAVSDFLKQFIRVERKPNTYIVTVEFVVEADNEEDANDKVSGSIRYGEVEDWSITDTRED